jgi:hypothetical protein
MWVVSLRPTYHSTETEKTEMPIPDTMWPAIRMVAGFAILVLGLSFTWKFIQAAFLGKVTYWTGLEKFGFLFAPLTLFISPMLCHLPYDPKKSLIQERQQLWVHLIFGPVFFISSLMCLTSGFDLLGLPGSTSLNTILTLGRHDIPQCIVYTPPAGTNLIGNYRFPFVKKATKVVLKALTIKVPEDKKNSYNAYEQKGEDVSSYSKGPFSEWFEDDQPVAPHTVPASNRK